MARATDGTWMVEGRRVERLVAQTDFENDESARRFQRELARLGIVDALRALGRRRPATWSASGAPSWNGAAEPGAWA